MKRVLLFTLSALFILNACKKENNIKPKNEEEELSNSVASVESVWLKSDGITDDGTVDKVYTYEKGKIIEYREIPPYNTLTYKYTANLITVLDVVTSPTVPDVERFYRLDNQGRLSSEEFKSEILSLYNYDNNGYLKSVESRNGYGKYLNNFTFKDGNLSTIEGTSPTGENYSATFTYSDENIRIPQNIRSFWLEETSPIHSIFSDISEPFIGKTLFTKVPRTLVQVRYSNTSETTRFYCDKKDEKGRITVFRIVSDPTYPGGVYTGQRYTVTYND